MTPDTNDRRQDMDLAGAGAAQEQGQGRRQRPKAHKARNHSVSLTPAAAAMHEWMRENGAANMGLSDFCEAGLAILYSAFTSPERYHAFVAGLPAPVRAAHKTKMARYALAHERFLKRGRAGAEGGGA